MLWIVPECKQSLYSQVFEDRMKQINDAHTHTFTWLYDDSKTGFEQWLREGKGLYWVSGKPGSGKSTLMKYALWHPRTEAALATWSDREKLFKAGFFFHERGTSLLQKSFDGLLRSILHQLLTDVPDLITFIGPMFMQKKEAVYTAPSTSSSHSQHLVESKVTWDTSELKHIFQAIFSQNEISGRVCLFVDALDEYQGSPLEIARFIKDIATAPEESRFQLKICVSSRPWNIFQDFFGSSSGIAIHDWTGNDISHCVTDTLDQSVRSTPERLAREISHRAHGVFLWVKLVLDDILQLFIDGESLEDLLTVLDDLPSDLEGYYLRILKKVHRRYHRQTYAMLNLVLADPSLTFLRFTLAMDFHHDDQSQFKTNLLGKYYVQRCREMERKVKAYCGGLVEIRPRRKPTDLNIAPNDSVILDTELERADVLFLHHTVKELLQKPESLDLVLEKPPELPRSPVYGHLHLAKFYLATSQIRDDSLPDHLFVLDLLGRKERYGILASEVVSKFLFHMQAIDSSWGQEETNLVDDFDLNMTLLSPLEYDGLTWYERWKGIRGSRSLTIRPPSFLAFAWSAHLFSYCNQKIKHLQPDLDAKDLAVLLCHTVYHEDPVRSSLDQNTSPLESSYSHSTAKYLLEHGASPNEPISVDRKTMTPFSLALSFLDALSPFLESRLELLQLFLEFGADPNQVRQYKNGSSLYIGRNERPLHDVLNVLQELISKKILTSALRILIHRLIVKLLDQGANPNLSYRLGTTPFELALPICTPGIIKKFMERGAKITRRMLANPKKTFSLASGILADERWCQPECFDESALEEAKKLNPDMTRKGWLVLTGSYVDAE